MIAITSIICPHEIRGELGVNEGVVRSLITTWLSIFILYLTAHGTAGQVIVGVVSATTQTFSTFGGGTELQSIVTDTFVVFVLTVTPSFAAIVTVAQFIFTA